VVAKQAVSNIRTKWLSNNPDLESSSRSRLESDYSRFAQSKLPPNLEHYLLENYGLDVSSSYAGLSIKNPWGKASGQLSMTCQQVAEDAEAGLGFCVLKTLIAADSSGNQSMAAWAIPESRMVLEPVQGTSGETGWTVSWRGRGWSRSFEDYVGLVRGARQIGDRSGMLVVPSCKFHLPGPGESDWRIAEYEYTCQHLIEAYAGSTASGTAIPMPIEKDFSPTLAGSGRSTERMQVLDWLRTVPRLVRSAAGRDRVRVGLKLFNALFEDDFQLEMLRAVTANELDRPDFLVYANRLFDPAREFEGQRGIAVGGPDLSDRNLRILGEFAARTGPRVAAPLDISATGNILSGRMAVEYLLRGCSSFQMHTLFQLPASEFAMKQGSKAAKAIHKLYFDPAEGFIAWVLHAARQIGISGTPIRIRDLVQHARSTPRSAGAAPDQARSNS